LTRRFAKIVQRVLEEAELPRVDFIRAAREFIESQRHHMRLEEAHFLPHAEAKLSDEDLAELGTALFERHDPLFGSRVEQKYAALRDNILKWEEADEAS
jgi:hemerythrin-like domain-containing protein